MYTSLYRSFILEWLQMRRAAVDTSGWMSVWYLQYYVDVLSLGACEPAVLGATAGGTPTQLC